MIGIIICCHGEMAIGMRSAAELIIGPQEKLETIALFPGQGQEDLRRALKKAIRKVGDEGTVILTDLPGGTPCNVSSMFVNDRVSMITGFNLPLLIKLLMDRGRAKSAASLVADAPSYAAGTIMDASFMLKGA